MDLYLNLSKLNKYIVAVSGGVDSMVLLDMLIKNQYDIVVVHFNHQKRKESILDHNLVESICLKNEIPYHYIKLSIKNGNFQEKARELRYSNLTSIASEYETNHIITAHHGDDLAETILMKIIRGSNLLGYAGMQSLTTINEYHYHKPLLIYSKEQLYNYASKHGISFNEDISNKSNDYFRNRIRNTVIPIIKDENNLITRFNTFSKQAFDASNYIRSQTISFLDNKLYFKLSDYILLHEAIKTDVISYLLEKTQSEKSFNKIYEIIKQLVSKKPNISIKLSKDFILIKSYDHVEFKPLEKVNNNLSDFELNISHKKADSPYNSIELCYNKLDFPIKVRSRLNGDILSFPFGRKKLKDLLIDKKVPKQTRDNLVIVVDSNNTILWIPNLYINQTLGDTHKIYFSIKE